VVAICTIIPVQHPAEIITHTRMCHFGPISSKEMNGIVGGENNNSGISGRNKKQRKE
jgi:hypothetical protein